MKKVFALVLTTGFLTCIASHVEASSYATDEKPQESSEQNK